VMRRGGLAKGAGEDADSPGATLLFGVLTWTAAGRGTYSFSPCHLS
jgi:hypothetical protein